MGLALLVWIVDVHTWSSRFNHRVRSFLLVLASNLDFGIIKIKFTNSHETRMGLVLLVWRNVVYTMLIVFRQTSKVIKQEICVTFLGCFNILRFEIIVMNFKNSYETRMGLALLVWREDFGQTAKVINQEWVCSFLVG